MTFIIISTIDFGTMGTNSKTTLFCPSGVTCMRLKRKPEPMKKNFWKCLVEGFTKFSSVTLSLNFKIFKSLTNEHFCL